MRIRRTAIWLMAAGLVLWSAGRAAAQPAHSNLHYQVPHPTYERGPAPFSNDVPGPERLLNPFHPVGFEPQFDWFAPAETSGYGRGPRPHIGYFFSYERLFWSLSKPQSTLIGSTTAMEPFQFFPDGPSADNSFIGATGAWGNRWELGYIDTDDYGWLVSVLDHVSQSQYEIKNSPAIPLLDPLGILDGTVLDPFFPLGQTPYMFAELRLKNILQLNGVEVTRFYRARQLHSGAFLEVLYGARWFQINDTFTAEADGNGDGVETGAIGTDTFSFPTNILDASIWSNRALNNLVGPQIGLRCFRQRGRWVASLEARFLAAANFQNLHLKTNLGTDTNINQGQINDNFATNFRGLGSNQHLYRTVFSPMGELRVNVSWTATRNVGLKVGYTGMVVGNVSRGSNTISYDDVNLIGLSDKNRHEVFFVNGVNFGVEINR